MQKYYKASSQDPPTFERVAQRSTWSEPVETYPEMSYTDEVLKSYPTMGHTRK